MLQNLNSMEPLLRPVRDCTSLLWAIFEYAAPRVSQSSIKKYVLTSARVSSSFHGFDSPTLTTYMART